jgi:NADH-quinone oxidoreductase subunit A
MGFAGPQGPQRLPLTRVDPHTTDPVSTMPFDFAQVLIFMLVAIGFVLVALTLSRLVAPRVLNADKGEIYECGERPIGDAWFNFNPRFYIIALVFVVFDVEVALTFPIAVVFKAWKEQGAGLIALAELLVFLVILAAGLAYVWKKRDLEWIKTVTGGPWAAANQSQKGPARRAAWEPR